MKRAALIIICTLLMVGASRANAGSYVQKVQAIRPGNMIGYWPFNETQGGTAFDVSGNNNNGVYSGAVLASYNSPDGGYGAYLDGYYSFIAILNNAQNNPVYQMSMSIWACLTYPWMQFSWIAQKSTSAWTDGGYGIFINDGDGLAPVRIGAWIDSYQDNLIEYEFYPGSCEHFVMSYDTNLLSLYHNGVLAGQILRPGILIDPVEEHLMINAGGIYSHLTLWDTALSDDEIAELFDPTGAPDATPTPALPTYSEAIPLPSGRQAGLFYSLTAGDVLIAVFLFMLLGLATVSLIFQMRQRR